MSADCLTILSTAGRDRDKLATKRISRPDGQWQIQEYSNATWWSVRQVQVHDLASLGRALADLEADPRDELDCWLSGQSLRHPERSCVIRGEPIEGINLSRTRRLKDPAADGTSPSFAPAARRWFAIDFDSLPTPVWNHDMLARRRAAIARDRLEHRAPTAKGEDDGEEVDLAGDEDPAPIDPARDWAISIRAAAIVLPLEFHDVSAYWQMTSSAGIKPGIRLRLWYWLDRPASDEEAKRWLKDSPVDTSLYSAVTPHYTAAPIFDPPELDPVPLRSGFWWRHSNVVMVPDLQEKPKPQITRQQRQFTSGEGAERYAQACVNAIVAAPDGQGRTKAIAVARRLYAMANHGLLDPEKVTTALTDAMQSRGWGQTERGRWSQAEIERHLAYSRAHPDPVLPEGFR